MQREDGSYRRAENCETVVSKGHLNVGSQLSLKMLWRFGQCFYSTYRSF